MLSLDNARRLAAALITRRQRFPDEDETTSYIVVVLNFGDHLTAVRCMGPEGWTGIKDELVLREPGGIPLCPNGHPCMEAREQQRLDLVPYNPLG